jgi:hypothetical protein
MKSSEWAYQVSTGLNSKARLVGGVFMVLAACATPGLFVSYLRLFGGGDRSAFVYFLCIVVCLVWIALANEVRKFTRGEAILNSWASGGWVRTHVATYKSTFSRWLSTMSSLGLMGLLAGGALLPYLT